jgi:exodeoxyribonuclease VII large subunit
LWRRDAQRLLPALRRAGVELAEGTALRCFGSVDFFPPTGRLQLTVSGLDPLFSVGALAQRRRETLEALASAGLLERNASLRLPEAPLRVGLIGSQGSAGVEDFLATLRATSYAFEVELVHAGVQGAAAEGELVAALERLERQRGRAGAAADSEVWVLVRGGGARGDLAAFDGRRLAEAIARASVPVLTGLGHEIDEAVADRVAHRAFKTPTGVAEFLVQRVVAFEARLLAGVRGIAWAASRRLAFDERRVERCRDRLAMVAQRLELRRSRVDRLADRLGTVAQGRLRALTDALESLSGRLAGPAAWRPISRGALAESSFRRRLASASVQRLRLWEERLRQQQRLLEELSPRRVLARGFSITRDANGALVRSVHQLAVGDVLHSELERGRLDSRVVVKHQE